MELRIIGGIFKGKKIAFPRSVRPTSTKVKKALFTVLGEFFDSGTFVDVFSGSGAVGIEAYSRGMSRVVFIEKDDEVLRFLRRNLKKLGVPYLFAPKNIPNQGVIVLPYPAARGIRALYLMGAADVIYIDPPYHNRWEKIALKALEKSGIVSSRSRIFLEHYKSFKMTQFGSLYMVKRRQYGDTVVSEFKKGIMDE